MKWFKHDSSAHTDAKLQKVLMKYRAEGYALYWYSLELIAGKVDKNNITFELEHDAEIIGFQLGIDQLKVQEIMHYMIDLGLFDVSQNNQIRCLKMAYRLDETTTKNPEVKAMLKALKSGDSPEAFRSDSGNTLTRSDQTRSNNKDLLVSDSSPTSKKFNYDPDHLKFAELMFQKIAEVMPRAKQPNFEKWAHEIRIAVKALKIPLTDFWTVFVWANQDPFWKTNILSPSKLREKFPQLEVKAHETSNQSNPANQSRATTAAQRLQQRHSGGFN